MSDKRADVRAGASVDELLDDGAQGLLFFEEFLPKYQRWVGKTTSSRDALNAQYDMQRGMNLEALASDADDLKFALAEADKQLTEQTGRAAILASSWTGTAADGAQQHLTQHLARARTDRDAFGDAHEAMTAAAAKLREIVTDKVNTIRIYDWHQIDGKTPGQVDDIVSGAKSSTLPVNPFGSDLRERLQDIFGISQWRDASTIAVASLFSGDSGTEEIIDHCRKWLNGVFVPTFESHVQNFEQANTIAANRIHDVYTELSAALNAVDATSYPPTGDPGVAQPSTPGSSPPVQSPVQSPGQQPGASPASTTSPANVTPTPATPSMPATPSTAAPSISVPSISVPSGLGLPALGLPDIGQIGSLVGGLAEGATKAVEAIGEAAGKAIEDVVEHLTPVEDDTDKSNNDAEFELGEHHVKVEMGPNGEATIEVIGADGQAKTYGLSIDEKGVPVISTPEPADAPEAPATPPIAAEPAEPAKPADPVAPAEQAPAQLGGGMLGARTQREDQPASDRVPTSPDAEPEPESGAQLAEAGPL